MRQTISGLVAAIAVVTASAVPAMACGGGLFEVVLAVRRLCQPVRAARGLCAPAAGSYTRLQQLRRLGGWL